MRFVHLSDTHLGYTSYRKLTADGYNQREEDVREAFVKAVDKIIELKPDFCIHSGDLFDSARPSNRNISLVLREFLRLTKNGIPVVVIAGNHETPKIRQLGHIFGVFEFFPDIYPVYKAEYRVIKLGEVAIHAVPQCPSAKVFEEELQKIRPEKGVEYNLLTLHAAIAGIPEFSRGDFNEQFVDQGCFQGFDWVALGHYHNYVQLQPNAAYAGSTERFSFAEATHQKGFLIVDLEKKETQFLKIEAREMVEFIITPSQLSTGDINREIEITCEKIKPKDKIVKFKVEGFDSSQTKLIDFRKFALLTREAIHSVIEVVPQDGEATSYFPSPQLSKLSDEFKLYLQQVSNLNDEDKHELEQLGLHYLSLVEEIDSD